MKDEKFKEIEIIPYEYFRIESGFKPEKVFVIKGDEHPDPAKRMLWGRTCDGKVISDFKRSFEKKGNSINVPFTTKAWTALDEKKDMLEAVDKHIKNICEKEI